MVDNTLSRLKQLFTGAHAAWHSQDEAVEDEAKLSRPQAFIHFWVLTVKSFLRDRVPVRASALAYSSLLALVPMLALVVSIAFGFLRGDEGQKHIENFIHYIVSTVVPSAGDSAEADKTVKDIQNLVKN
jgi:membrane protein